MQSAVASLFVALLASGSANAWFRVACTDPLVQERVDPITSPTITPSQYVNTVHGASNFRGNSTYELLRASSCTSCLVTQDLSSYWFPKLYFHDPKTKLFEPVGNGGLLIYYQNRGDGDVSNGGMGLKAFPPGFKMISGNPVARSKKYVEGEGSQAELRERAVKWACLRYGTSSPSYDGKCFMTTARNTVTYLCDFYFEGHGFPTTDCEAGFNARLDMPACWDGQNVDSADHISHVSYLSGLDHGSCPSTHPVYLPKLFYEVTWNVHDFASRWNATDGWPFVYSTGDPTGYSWHGDFQNGWDTAALQNAIDKCNNPNDQTGSGNTEACPYLTVAPSTQNKCKIAPEVKETIDGQLAKLPGCNPIQSGPGDATLYTGANCPQ